MVWKGFPEGNPAGLSSCSGGLRPLVELCVEPAGLCGRCTGVAVPLRVVPSPTGPRWRNLAGLFPSARVITVIWGAGKRLGNTACAVKRRGPGADSHPPLGRPCPCSDGWTRGALRDVRASWLCHSYQPEQPQEGSDAGVWGGAPVPGMFGLQAFLRSRWSGQLNGFLSCQLPSLLAGNCPIREPASGFQRISSINTPRDRSNAGAAATGTRIIVGGAAPGLGALVGARGARRAENSNTTSSMRLSWRPAWGPGLG